MRAEALDREAELQRSGQLTGLPNRAMFLHCLAHALDLHRRGRRPLAVLFDLDDFRADYDPIMALARTRELQLRDLLRQAITVGAIEAGYQPNRRARQRPGDRL